MKNRGSLTIFTRQYLLLLVGTIVTATAPDISAQGIWVPTGSMTQPHSNGHTATLLHDGNVLVAGGLGTEETSIAAAETYERKTGAWHVTASMTERRGSHTATLLHNGMVLVVGGLDQQSPGVTVHATAELYDPKEGTWKPTGSLSGPRALHRAELLSDGSVLVVGGFSQTDVLASAEVYDPGTGAWSAVSSMNTARFLHTMTPLHGQGLLVAGGYDSTGVALSSAELFDPVSGTWTQAGSMAGPRGAHTATRLPNGNVLVAGGIDVPMPLPPGFPGLASAEVYDAQTGAWIATASMSSPRFNHTGTALHGGDVLAAAGEDADVSVLSSAERYDPKTGLWSPTGDLTTRRATHTATLLRDGRVLVAGGFFIGTALASAELYLPKE
jgi:hypothetical protein